MDSEEFFDQYSRGQLSDDAVFVEWANDYRHYLELRQRLEKSLQDVDDALADYLEKLSKLFSSAALLTLNTILKRL
jgi:hypothetical protein